jgi:hypothetical protein
LRSEKEEGVETDVNDESRTLLHTQKKGTALALRMCMGQIFHVSSKPTLFGNISE